MDQKTSNERAIHSRSLSLRMTLIRMISGVLVFTLIFSAVLTYWHAIRKIETELGAAIEMAEKTVRQAIEEIAHEDDPVSQLARLVRVFDGNRHVKASFVEAGPEGRRTSSFVAPADDLPEWFFKLLATPPRVLNIELPDKLQQFGTFELKTSLRGEMAEVWDDVVLKITILSVFCVLASLLVYIVLGRVLEPITGLTAAFERLGGGDYGVRVEVKGPIEIEKLCGGFNAMAQRLGDMEVRNRKLNEQLVTVQDEERAELARDLHDEVSPFLFSVDVDASTIKQLAETSNAETIAARADAICEAIAHIKKHVRSILNRLRPAMLLEDGLKNAIATLVASWQLRHPDVTFVAVVADRSCGAKIDGVIHGIVREAISNALKHGKPEKIDVQVTFENEDYIKVSVCDDGGGFEPMASSTGFGLIAMRERAEALGGSVHVQNRPDGLGVEVTVRIPVPTQLPGDTNHKLDVSL